MHLPLGLPCTSLLSYHSYNNTIKHTPKTAGQVTKKFSEWKQAHVGMEILKKNNQTRWEWHHNTFTPSPHSYIPGRRLFGVWFQVGWLSNISPPILHFLCLLDLCACNKDTTFSVQVLICSSIVVWWFDPFTFISFIPFFVSLDNFILHWHLLMFWSSGFYLESTAVGQFFHFA